jgi:hypothetical protein
MDQTLCCDRQRRIDVANSATLNGIDFVEVIDVGAQFQQELRVHFLRSPAPQGITAANVVIAGGERFTGLLVDEAPHYDGDVLVLHVNAAGDFSTYTLRLVQADGSGLPMDGLDPVLSTADFSFKIACASPFDGRQAHTCSPAVAPSPEIDHLAKDYAGFRQLMLDRLAVLVPGWQESHAADLGVTLVEMLAYVADHLSYYQDAVATEAYLGTARLRTSVRRHARLVDYFMHEGCSARAWVAVRVQADQVVLPAHTPLIGGVAGTPPVLPTAAYAAVLAEQPTVFETMHEATLFQAHEAMGFHTWGDKRCALPKGAIRATLRGRFAQLKAGDVLLLEEVMGPLTGRPEDTDPTHRQAVRLTSVTLDDAKGAPLIDPLYDLPITQIEWAKEDALAFALCLSSRIAGNGTDTDLTDVSVARGNIVLVDHGHRIAGIEPIGTVPEPHLFRAAVADGAMCTTAERQPVPPRFRPSLAQAPLTWAVPFDATQAGLSATALARPDPASAIPALQLSGHIDDQTLVWSARRDLLGSRESDTDVVVEPDDHGTTWLRFGDATHGRRPPPGMSFSASYRIGSGAAGNVGAGTLASIVTDDEAVLGVYQPLPAGGGIEPESIASVRAKAPYALRTQQRAVTASDYARVAAQLSGVQSAAATLRWTGSWHSVLVSVDQFGGAALTAADEARLSQALQGLRMAGHDVAVEAPISVPLEIVMLVNVKPDYFRADVAQAVSQVFSSRVLPNGQLGFFHPDNFRIGQDVYSSPLYAAAMAIDGVVSAQITTFQRRDQPGRAALDSGVLPIGRLELARLDNNPDFPERGVFSFSLRGGQ